MTAYDVVGLTYADLMKQLGAPQQMLDIAEVLKGYNTLMMEAPFAESNAIWANKTVQRASEPAGTWRGFYQGIAPSKSQTITVQDVIGSLEDYSNVDKKLADTAPGGAGSFRSQEDRAFVRGLTKEMEATAFYGNAYEDPNEFNGMAVRRMDLNYQMVIDNGGASSNLTSVYVVTWGMEGCYFGYPPGSMGGLKMDDLGVQVVEDNAVSNRFYRAYQTWFSWDCGLIVRNPRCLGRIANIKGTGASNTFDEDKLIDLLVEMETGPGTMIYLPRTIMAQAWKRLKDKENTYFDRATSLDAGGPPLYFNGFPIRMSDQIYDGVSSQETVVADV